MLKSAATAAALLALIAGPALAQPKTLVVAGYGGSWAQHLSAVVLQRILGGLMLLIGLRFLFFAK